MDENTYVIYLWIERFLMERIETWPSLKRKSRSKDGYIQFYPNIKIVKIIKNRYISSTSSNIYKTNWKLLIRSFFFLFQHSFSKAKSKLHSQIIFFFSSRLTMIHRTTEYTVLTNPSISLSPTLWSYTYFIIVSRRIHCFEAHAPFKNTRVCMYVCTYIYIWMYEYFYANARMFASLFRVRRKKFFISREVDAGTCSKGSFPR